MATAAAIVDTPFRIVETTIGPGAARYRDLYKARMEWRERINGMLSSYDERIKALDGSAEYVQSEAAKITAEREAAYQDLLSKNPLPPNPNEDASISDEDKRLYTLLQQSILANADKDIPLMETILGEFQKMSEAYLVEAEAKIRDEIEKKEKADARAERKHRRTMHRSKIGGVIGYTVGGVLSAIPLVVTQVIGAVISVGTAIATSAVEIDAARRLAYSLRDNANWLVYEQPLLIEEMEQEEFNLDYVEALLPLASSLKQTSALRQQINSEKLKAGIYDEEVLAASKKGTKVVWKVVLYAGLAYAAWRILWK